MIEQQPTYPAFYDCRRQRLLRRGIAAAAALFMAALFCAAAAMAAPPEVDTIRERYLRLRNTDPLVKRPGEWRRLREEIEQRLKVPVPEGEKVQLLMRRGRLCRELYLAHEDHGDRRCAQESFAAAAAAEPDSEGSAEARLELGKFLLRIGERGDGRDVLQALIESHPGTERAFIADALLNGAKPPSPGKRQDSGSGQGVLQGRHIVIDPGHGGEDLGAVGIGGLLEKDVVLAVALLLERTLLERGASVTLTRRGDNFVPLESRTARANSENADLFISLHANASPATGKISGLEIYRLDNSGDKASAALAERENRTAPSVEAAPPGDLQFMLSDLLQSAKLDESSKLAAAISSALHRNVSKQWRNAKNGGVKSGPFYVLVGAHMPCVLVELFYIDHPEDGRRLADKSFHQSAARGLADGIQQFLLEREA